MNQQGNPEPYPFGPSGAPGQSSATPSPWSAEGSTPAPAAEGQARPFAPSTPDMPAQESPAVPASSPSQEPSAFTASAAQEPPAFTASAAQDPPAFPNSAPTQPSQPWGRPAPVGYPTSRANGAQPSSYPSGPAPQVPTSSAQNSSHPLTDHTAIYGSPEPEGGRKGKKRSSMAGLVAVALLAAAGGGAIGTGATLAMQAADEGSMLSASNTQVVQADPSNPDWSAVAEATSDAVVAIQVSGSSGSGEGSGVILDGYGNIVTNNHVIMGGAGRTQITVVINNQMYAADVVGTDPSTDLAVIRLVDPPGNLESLSFGDSSALAVGDPVMAIGNPLGLSDTVTTGIVSAIDRPVTTRLVSDTVGDNGNGTVVTAAIQTNAAINPGNSGGALVNGAGELIGIPSSIATVASSASSQSGNIGIGFAIPANQVQNIVEQLLANGEVQHAQLGVSASDVRNSTRLGAQIVEVVPGSAASEADVRVGDIVTAVDARQVASAEALVAVIRSAQVGQPVTLTVYRGETEIQIQSILTAAS